MDYRESLAQSIEEKKQEFIRISNQIWEYAEPRFQEEKSSALQQQYLKEQGFAVRSDLAGEKTAFIAEYGSGKPVIAFLGEFDALSGLSQEADNPERAPIPGCEQGHGCGHQLLGTGALAAAVALKEKMQADHLPGTIRYYGCPAEENAGGKAYLVRDGYFDDCDVALTWHASTTNTVAHVSSLANFRVFFTFHGLSSHAAGAPHLGRSALDAVELMNVGVNYMREHMISTARVHYAVTNTGGTAPNVVQSEAQVLYAIRAPKVTQVKELYNRICKIAQGAALMTETTVDIQQVSAYSNLIRNEVISQQMYDTMDYFLPQNYTEEELEYARTFQKSISDLDRSNLKNTVVNLVGKEKAKEVLQSPMLNFLCPIPTTSGSGSTDVGDVSWVVPTSYFYTACWAAGTPGHAWQQVAQGKSSIAHKGMLLAAKVLACVGYAFLTQPELVQQAHDAWVEDLDGESYPNPLPKDLKPFLW